MAPLQPVTYEKNLDRGLHDLVLEAVAGASVNCAGIGFVGICGGESLHVGFWGSWSEPTWRSLRQGCEK